MRRLFVLLLLVIAALAVTAPASAHDPISVTAAATPGAEPVSDVGVASLLVAVGFLMAVARARRRGLVTFLVALLLVFAFEAGLHSVHHLGKPQRAGECLIASAAAHVGGAPIESIALELPALNGIFAEQSASSIILARTRLPEQQRAPPVVG